MTQSNTNDNENSPNLNDLVNHFQKLYHHQDESLNNQKMPTIKETRTIPSSEVNKRNQHITYNDVKTTLLKLKNKKAPGFDRISKEMLIITDSVINILKEPFNKILNAGIFPKQWNYSLIKTIFKGGDKDNPSGYRGISLNSTIGKVFCSILHNRLLTCCEENKILREEQAAFRKKYTTTDHIYLLRHSR